MTKTEKIFGVILLAAGMVAVTALASQSTFAVFEPAGQIATKERQLILITLAMSLIVVIPVFTMTIYFVWKYREGNNAEYKPDWDGNRTAETIWWTVPLVLIAVLAVITWQSSHELDPYKPIASTVKPVTVQVVALPWKWLFIYPDYGVASINYLPFPVDTPLNLKITADAPMNSLWIPQLGGQIYAMAGMQTILHLIADRKGSFRGSSANLSGKGFAGMKFEARATSLADFESWALKTRDSEPRLTSESYNELAKPSENVAPTAFAAFEHNLYDKVMLKYRVAGHEQLSADDDPSAIMNNKHGAGHTQ